MEGGFTPPDNMADLHLTPGGRPGAIGAENGHWQRWKTVLDRPTTWPTCINPQGVGQGQLGLETATGDGERWF